MELQPANAFILHRQAANTWSVFIDYWANSYDYSAENTDYDLYVAKRDDTFEFDKANLRKLFEWKNNTGEKLTSKKESTVNKLIDKLPEINQLLGQWNDVLFQEHFGKISAVWQTYLMHIIQPDRFPIFDQHVYRAFAYLQLGKPDELQRLNTTKQKLGLYRQYQSFFDGIKQESGCATRDIDKALWAFGRFIKQYKVLL